MTVYALDLDEELVSHLSNADSWQALSAEEFDPLLIEDSELREVYNWQVTHVHKHHKPATASVIAEQFDLDLREPETAIGDLIDRMRERYLENEIRDRMDTLGKAYKEDPTAVPGLLTKLGKELGKVTQRRGEMFSSEDVDRAYHRYNKKVLQGPGASLGFPELDDYFYGMRGVTLLLAPPKTMKSWIMCQMTIENTRQDRLPWLYTLELPCEEADMRLRCLMAGIPWWKYIYNKLTTQDWKAIREAKERLEGQYKAVKPHQGERSIDAMVHRARDAGAEVVLIDQLQYVENGKGQSIGSLNNTGDYWDVLNRARDLSDDGPICFAHQFNRSAMYADSMPQVEQAKGSSSIEEVATLALGMWGSRAMRNGGCIEMGTLIARNHEYASWELRYDLSHDCLFQIGERIPDDDEDDSKPGKT